MTQRTLIPMEVLCWLSPILAPADGLGSLRHRASLLWGLAPSAARGRETLWLAGQFPHHAEEAIDSAQAAVYQKGGSRSRHEARVSAFLVPRLDYQASPRLAAMFDQVWRRYLRWSGNQLVVRAGKTEELHNLALLFPVSQLVHHAYARALCAGHVSRDRLRELTWRPQHLPSESSALTRLASRGLAEGHVHLGGIASAEELWADHLLTRRPLAPGRDQEEQRDRLLGEVSWQVLRLTALAPLLLHRWRARGESAICLKRCHHKEKRGDYARDRSATVSQDDAQSHREGDDEVEGRERQIGLLDLHHMLDEIDRICALSDYTAAHCRTAFLARRIQVVIDAVLAEGNPGGERGWLDRPGYDIAILLLAPHRFILGRHHRFPPSLRSDPRLATATHRRQAAIDWLHLELHRLLLDLPTGRRLLHRPEQVRSRWLEPATGDTALGFEKALQGYVERVLSNYLVLLTIHHCLGTHRGRRMGLRRFQRSFKARQRRPTKKTEQFSKHEMQRYTAAQVRELLADLDLRLVEGRVAPSVDGRETIRPWLLGYEEAWNPNRPDAERRPWRSPRQDIAFGLVVHFKKTADRPLRRPPRRLLEPQSLPRHHRCRERTRRQAFDLFRFLRRPDPQVPFVVGIDAAGHELDAPPEVFAPAFRFLRQQPIDCQPASMMRWSVMNKRSFFHLIEGRRLGMTFHVGEDFRHLLSGLRAVWEAVCFLAPQPGDRLGHAIAVGAAPETWAGLLAGQALVPRQEWLDNLIWVWHFLGPGHDLLGDLKIEDEIQKHAAIIYENLHDEHLANPLDFYHAWALRAIDPDCLSLENDTPWADATRLAQCSSRLASGRQRRNFERFRSRLATSPALERWIAIQRQCFEELNSRQMRRMAFQLHWLYLYDRQVRKRGEEMLTIPLDQPWLDLIRLAQGRMRQKLHERQLVVEVNPTSNRLIGPMGGIPDHHVFRLTRDRDEAPALVATVNTDDPGVFQTSLPHEFYLLGEELLARGEEEHEVLHWLEELRVNGLEYSFLKRLQESPAEVRSAVLDDLRKLYGGFDTTRKRWFVPADKDGHRCR